MSLSRAVAIAGPVAILFVVVGFFASIGHGTLGPLPAALAAPLHGVLAALGAAAGVAARRRQVEIDTQRFEYVRDPHATKGERELAHKHAERELRLAHVALLGVPLALGYWLAYELPPGAPPWARALPASALVGYGLSQVLRRRGV